MKINFNFNKLNEAFDFNEVSDTSDITNNMSNMVDDALKKTGTNIKLVLSKLLDTTKIRTFGEQYSPILETPCAGKQVVNPNLGIVGNLYSIMHANWISIQGICLQDLFVIQKLYSNSNYLKSDEFNNSLSDNPNMQFFQERYFKELLNPKMTDINTKGYKSIKTFMEFMPYKCFNRIIAFLTQSKPEIATQGGHDIYLMVSKDKGVFCIVCLGRYFRNANYYGSGWVMLFGFTGEKIYEDSISKEKLKATPDTYNNDAKNLVKSFKHFGLSIDKDTMKPEILKDGRLGLIAKCEIIEKSSHIWSFSSVAIRNQFKKIRAAKYLTQRHISSDLAHPVSIDDKKIKEIASQIIPNYTENNAIPWRYVSYNDYAASTHIKDKSIPLLLTFIYVNLNTNEGQLICTTYEKDTKLGKDGWPIYNS